MEAAPAVLISEESPLQSRERCQPPLPGNELQGFWRRPPTQPPTHPPPPLSGPLRALCPRPSQKKELPTGKQTTATRRGRGHSGASLQPLETRSSELEPVSIPRVCALRFLEHCDGFEFCHTLFPGGFLTSESCFCRTGNSQSIHLIGRSEGSRRITSVNHLVWCLAQ